MHIPPIYQPIELVLGVGQISTALLLLGTELFRLRKLSLRAWVENSLFVGISIFLVTNGLLYLSRAFDPPHRASSLTNSFQWVGITGFVILVTLESLARRFRKSQPEQTPTKIEK